MEEEHEAIDRYQFQRRLVPESDGQHLITPAQPGDPRGLPGGVAARLLIASSADKQGPY